MSFLPESSAFILPLAMFAFVSSVTPGPNNVMLTASGATFGYRRSMPHMLGICMGVVIMVLMIGAGLGKAAEVPEAIRKGVEDAKKNMITVALKNGTIPHPMLGIYGAGKVIMKPAAEGTGIKAGGPVRAVLALAGIRNILTKSLGSSNPINMVRATMDGLSKLENAETVAALRGKSLDEIYN